jgi:hypothetical protein
VDRVHGGWRTGPWTLIKWVSSAEGSMAQIKKHERVSDNLILAVNAGMDGSRWLGRQGRRDRGGVPGLRWWLAGVSHYRRSGPLNSTRFSPTAPWRRGELDSLTLWRQQTAVTAGDCEAVRLASGGGLRWLWGGLIRHRWWHTSAATSFTQRLGFWLLQIKIRRRTGTIYRAFCTKL